MSLGPRKEGRSVIDSIRVDEGGAVVKLARAQDVLGRAIVLSISTGSM